MSFWQHDEDSEWGCTRLTLTLGGVSQELWECDDCAALTRNPYRHNEWHHEERTHRP